MSSLSVSQWVFAFCIAINVGLWQRDWNAGAFALLATLAILDK